MNATFALAQADDSTAGPLLIATALAGISLALLALWSMWRRRGDLARTRLREQWLATMLRSIGDAVVATDAAGRVTFMNGVAQELTGWKEADAAQRPLIKVFQTLERTTRQATENPIDKVVREGHSISHAEPVLLLARDGTERFVQSCAAPIRGESGNVSGVVFVFRDVTQRELGESALRASQEMFHLITDHISDFIAVLDLEGRRLYASNSYADILAPPRDLYMTSSFAEIHPDDRERIQNAFAETVRTGAGSRVEYRFVGRDGAVTELESVGSVVRDAAGRPEKVLIVSRDIGERRAAETALREAHASLEIKVAERTRDLAAANERLQELDRLKSEFLATMSHELRTPLNSIIGFTGILRQGLAGPLNDEQKKQLGMVHSSARHLLGLITDLLDLSRIESGKMGLAREEFRAADLVSEVVQSLAPLAGQKKLRFESALDQPGLVLHSDRKKCFQILLNLANNALKFTDAGGVRLAVRTTPASVGFSVSDTGIGIKAENMAHLFEAFRQVDGSARRVYEGTGLGLYLSRQLANMLGGTIKAESEFGIGSRFTFTLPREVSPPTGS